MLITRVQRLIISLRVKSIRAESRGSPPLKYWAPRGSRSMTTPEAGAWSNYTWVAASIHLPSWRARRSGDPLWTKSHGSTVMEGEEKAEGWNTVQTRSVSVNPHPVLVCSWSVEIWSYQRCHSWADRKRNQSLLLVHTIWQHIMG